MSEFQMTHVALVGARIDAFAAFGYSSRSDLSLRRIIPDMGLISITDLDRSELRSLLAAQLPYWVHNIITDSGFPQRSKLLMALRRFEGEMRDNRNDEVVAAVLSAGFRNRQLDPLKLPKDMPLRQRCTMVMQIATWQDAYRLLERDLTSALADSAAELKEWLATAESEIDQAVAV